ncbi:MAG: Glyoxalase/bleomycin resistance protein/dioxygenase [Rariglobus sp.]|jgi:predicted enzyme related to lactoylglutathione lyase|nr:Glyoxalase/bleomycin resistance protein/dioxygenase [Rariglobus sp.]
MNTSTNATASSPIRVLEFAFTGYPVTDVARARAFYEGVLGLKTGMVWEEADHAWIEYDAGGHTLAINNSSKEWKPSASGPAIALEVEDFDATIAALKERSVRFTVEPFQSPVCRIAVILDPDGNSLAIHKRNVPAHG